MNYYQMCCRYRGQVVTIRDRYGRVHRGRIANVTPTHVYISPYRARGLGGYGYGFYGGWGYWGAPYAVPLAFIAGFALGGLLWW